MAPDPKEQTTAPTPAWLPVAVLMAAVTWLAIRESGALSIGDVWWHLRTGDLVLDSGPPRQDLFSWTAAGETWRPNAWVGDAVWAGARSIFGAAAVSLLVGILVLALSLVLYRYCRRRGAGTWGSVAATTMAVIFLAPFIVPRPLLLGLILVPITMEVYERYRKGSTYALASLAALMILWANLHGSFVVGVALIGAMAGGWAIDARTLKRPAAAAITVLVAGAINPYGPWAYIQTVVNRSESVTIEEWQPLSITDSRGVVVVVFMVLTALALSRALAGTGTSESLRGHYWEIMLPVLGLAVAAFWSIRMASFYLPVAAPVVALGFTAVRSAGLRKWASARVAPLSVGIIAAGLVLAFQQLPELADAGEPAPQFPEDLVAAIPQDCRLLNEYELGGFIIDRRWPEVLVSQDGRADLYGLDRLVEQEQWLGSTDVAAVEEQGIGCVLAESTRPLVTELAGRPDWAEVASARGYVLYERR